MCRIRFPIWGDRAHANALGWKGVCAFSEYGKNEHT